MQDHDNLVPLNGGENGVDLDTNYFYGRMGNSWERLRLATPEEIERAKNYRPIQQFLMSFLKPFINKLMGE